MAGTKRRKCSDPDVITLHKELDEVLCPICMEHPHNAVLLLCSSHKKGCRSYICDTSYRHSNCLDRYKNLRADVRNGSSLPHSLPNNQLDSSNTSDPNLGPGTGTDSTEAHLTHHLNGSDAETSVGLLSLPSENDIPPIDGHLEVQGEEILGTDDSASIWERVDLEEPNVENTSELRLSLKCPLCRGAVLGREVVEEARKYLNLKPRNCSWESCSFVGNYRELRWHARRIHPTARPADIDPSRERAWRNLENQREYGDIVSAIRSAMPSAFVLGDYVVENGGIHPGEMEMRSSDFNSSLWATFFLFQMIDSIEPITEPRDRSRAWMRYRRSSRASSQRRFVWGENLLGLQDDENDDEDMNMPSDEGGDELPLPRRRRRSAWSRPDAEQS
ncbi:uncharacterized protein LOC131155655 [Malania oleifera]|uniref:uncharacterized protein LOC131155655 n=1 Tax=Malania oleifera TaxID=397392 RepID=UPI0025AE89FD|nr:uncharacterized protein LOC131155655 [Malania oleifera]XP_057964907.1 uncharacterized protein LOC131155655 [Malania oleifera]XP_057964908.1 uncharacterized protein LOC131155655 [Malania oleifera]XP_057964909.1 uncharacterized protein LOC131155655 [Malania oleifera]XP_057964910.1 uncharacterized protein LOC131155655 [Malania oleifera]XP_057964911.1 uncharacterized protein LOC131155655 [Malania oleifera]XP_057964912.1 uncharacterized protein LOC131155655 [Malania oleifera]